MNWQNRWERIERQSEFSVGVSFTVATKIKQTPFVIAPPLSPLSLGLSIMVSIPTMISIMSSMIQTKINQMKTHLVVLLEVKQVNCWEGILGAVLVTEIINHETLGMGLTIKH